MHAILRTIADESVISYYHMMKSLLLHATQRAPRDKRSKGNPRRCATPDRTCPENSGDETSMGGNTTDGYTSGAINSDEEPYNFGSLSGAKTANETDPLLRVAERQAWQPATLAHIGNVTPASGMDSAVLTTSHCLLLDECSVRPT